MKEAILVEEVIKKFGEDITNICGDRTAAFSTFCSSDNPKTQALAWSKSQHISNLLSNPSLSPSVIITDLNQEDYPFKNGVAILQTAKPKLLFIKLLKQYFEKKPQWGIEQTATISPKAEIHPETYIGPNCVIGAAKIGKGCIIEGNNFIYDNVILKQNVIVQAGAVLGSKGMSLARESDGKLLDFPSLGELIIEEGVEIGSNSVIDMAVLEKTVIGAGTKINSLTFIGNTVSIGDDNYISVCVNVNGSVKIGNRNFIGSGSSIRNKATVGSDNTIGSGSIVVKNISDNNTVYGNPAKESTKSKGIEL
jgi:UDP-3-O-[3-hydroxymyristoyl] glucosamine N-acyltransferase